MKNKILIAFFVIGIGITLPGGILSGNPIISVLTYSLISSLILVGLVFGLLTFLESKVPEFIELLNSPGFESSGEDSQTRESSDSSTSEESSFEAADSGLAPGSSDIKSTLSSTSNPAGSEKEVKNEKPRNGKFGDHIMVDNIPIKNEPKLMAEAIRTIMAQDDMPVQQAPGKQK